VIQPNADVSKVPRIQADFNGLFGDLICISHTETCTDDTGAIIKLHEGLQLEVFDTDTNERGDRDDLVATGIVVPSPEWLQCRGSKWALRIDEYGVRRQSELCDPT
jgi:hypothetical protein